MKLKPFLAAILITLLFASSCKKDSAPQTYPIQGLWTGTYTVDNLPAQGSLFYSFIIYPDGTLLSRSKGGDGNYYYTTGTWNLVGNAFTGTITAFFSPGSNATITQSVAATYSNSGTLTNGTWMLTSGGTQSGKFSTLLRVN